MNQIKIKEVLYQSPATFDEMTPKQFTLTAQKMLQTATGTDDDTYYLSMTGIDQKCWNSLHFFHQYSIKRLFDFTSALPPLITKQLLPCIEIDEQQFIGYQPGFSNTTWQEFIFADQYIINGKSKEAAACLYRPQRPDYTGETDRRIPFTIYGANSRMHHFNNLSEPELFAFVLNYKALRKRNLEEKYPFVFVSSKQLQTDDDDNPSNSQFLIPNSQFSWIPIHRNLLGDHFFDEPKFYDLNVHVILNRLNTVIKENRKKT